LPGKIPKIIVEMAKITPGGRGTVFGFLSLLIVLE
jgi:hypothetical protein